jgi:hypothetical protein
MRMNETMRRIEGRTHRGPNFFKAKLDGGPDMA